MFLVHGLFYLLMLLEVHTKGISVCKKRFSIDCPLRKVKWFYHPKANFCVQRLTCGGGFDYRSDCQRTCHTVPKNRGIESAKSLSEIFKILEIFKEKQRLKKIRTTKSPWATPTTTPTTTPTRTTEPFPEPTPKPTPKPTTKRTTRKKIIKTRTTGLPVTLPGSAEVFITTTTKLNKHPKPKKTTQGVEFDDDETTLNGHNKDMPDFKENDYEKKFDYHVNRLH